MKKLFIIYQLMFFLCGSVILSNVHLLSHSDHGHFHDKIECIECEVIKNSENYILDFCESNFSNNIYNQIVFQKFIFVENKFNKKYNTRAPPIS